MLRDPSAAPLRTPSRRAIANGEGWSISEYICRLGPEDRPFEEWHEQVAISAVIEGSFQYRSAAGRALLYPGSFILGNAGTCFECGHTHSRGDRCIAFHFDPAFFEEIAATAAGSYRFRFPVAMLPALRDLALPIVEIKAAVTSGGRTAMDELAIRLAENVLALVSGVAADTAAPAAKDQRRISAVLRYIEEHAEQPLDLGDLAEMACMSKYHFLRTFRRTTGVTPHQFLLGVRMRRAALALRTTSLPIADVAFSAGFGDLSNFNAQFRGFFGVNPGAFRKAGLSD